MEVADEAVAEGSEAGEGSMVRSPARCSSCGTPNDADIVEIEVEV